MGWRRFPWDLCHYASTKAALKMSNLGFKVKELIGGVAWWKFDGYVTEGEQTFNSEPIKCAC
jgi:hypothetical protein